MLDLTEMSVFARVVERGSFTAAARELRVASSTLSRKVASLERRLGARLLERTTRRLQLTDVGTTYYERCLRIVREAEEADALVIEISNAPRGTLRLAAPPVWGEMYLGPPLAEYAKRYQAVQVDVVLRSHPVDPGNEHFDLVLRVADTLPDSSKVVRRLGLSTPILCASPAYLQARGEPRSLDELSQHTLISLGSPPLEFGWHFVDRGGGVVRRHIKARVRVNSSRLAFELCREGLGMALLPTFIVKRYLMDGTLVQVLPEVKAAPRQVCLLLSSKRQLSPAVRAFLDVLDGHFARRQPWD